MRFLALILALLPLCGPARAADAKPGASDCAIDRNGFMTQDLNAFDQGPDGFRSVISAGDLCVAELIADYRNANPAVLEHPDSYLLYWHEGQYRAFAGQTQRAQELFERSRMHGGPAAGMWNLYVDGSVAFLRQDRPALLEAREALAALPPETYHPIPRPMNLDVLDGLIGCFGKPYADAYGATCRQ